MTDTYDRISRSIDAINDIVLDKLSDTDAWAVMAQEVEILRAVSEPWGDHKEMDLGGDGKCRNIVVTSR